MIAKKSLGQHFLICGWVADTLIKAADIGPADTVLEIGPGQGALTRPLAAAAGRVIAVEKDERLAAETAAALEKEGIANVRIVTGDILSLLKSHFNRNFNGETVGGLMPARYKIAANIPYYLTGHLLRLIFESKNLPQAAALTVQKEVAERMIAKPPRMNLLALSVTAFGKPEIIKIVPASCFSPKPKVDSAIIRISDISDKFFMKNALDRHVFFHVIRSSFGQKRKQLVNSLARVAGDFSPYFPTGMYGDKRRALEILRAAGINLKARPEELTLEQWALIYRIAGNLPRQ